MIGAAWRRELGKGETSMKLRALFGLVLASSMALASAGCSRNAIEAINLANDADKQKDVDVDGAISKYEQASQLDPTNHRILFKLGMAYKKKEAWDKLASTMARATQMAPKFANYWYWRGAAIEMLAEKKTGSWEEAKEPLKKCIEADPNYADCYHDLGRAYLWTDGEQDALVNYTKAIEHKPDELKFYGPLAELYLNLNFTDQASQVLKDSLAYAKEGDKYAYDVHVLLSQVYQSKNQMNDMVTELESARKLAGETHPEILYNLGSTYAVLNPPRKTEAIQLLKSFSVRACRGSAATGKYKDQCEGAQSLVAKLGGSMQ
jgi:tetratricopeptide (TPR) repeat protein